ncbi:hypothetical protein [Streptomyces sp. NPDC048603]|uniref:hypothetical protein n=1 Tax=Streptomyces sp. NPDC048603 TaxID=3365577 RepID=UPI0037197263
MTESTTYEFLAVDEPLDEMQRLDVRLLSNWSCDSPRTLVATASIRAFQADPRVLMERYFDVHAAVSPWGTRELIFRMPQDSFSVPLARRYGAESWTAAGHALVVLRTDFAGRTGGGAEHPVSRFTDVREDLAAGGRRALYLSWLASLGDPDAYAGAELPDLEAETEPPVPPNLTDLGPGLTALAEFLCVDGRLLRVAAEASQDTRSQSRAHSRKLSQWIHRLPDADKNRLLLRALQGGAAGPVEARITGGATAPRRTVADLLRRASARDRCEVAMVSSPGRPLSDPCGTMAG